MGATDPHGFTGQSDPLVWVKPTGWEQSEDTDPAEPLRTCHYELRISARGDGTLGPSDFLEAKGDQLVKAIQHQDLGGALPGLTHLGKARVESRHQIEELVIEGSSGYLRDDPSDTWRPRIRGTQRAGRATELNGGGGGGGGESAVTAIPELNNNHPSSLVLSRSRER